MNFLRTALVKFVDFQFVNVAERQSLAQLDVLVVLGNDGWFSVHRVGVPKHVHRCYDEYKLEPAEPCTQTTTYIPKCMTEL